MAKIGAEIQPDPARTAEVWVVRQYDLSDKHRPTNYFDGWAVVGTEATAWAFAREMANADLAEDGMPPYPPDSRGIESMIEDGWMVEKVLMHRRIICSFCKGEIEWVRGPQYSGWRTKILGNPWVCRYDGTHHLGHRPELGLADHDIDRTE